MQFENIFLGNTPNYQRRYIVELFKFLKDKYPIIYIPAVGQFALAKCAILAGYDKKNIYTSEISLFSTILGYFYTSKPVDSIGFKMSDEYQEEYKTLTEEIDKVAFLMWLMKVKQVESDLLFMSIVKDEFIKNKETYIIALKKRLEEAFNQYSGINYEVADLRHILTCDKESVKETLVVLNPPAYTKGYEKMFDFKGALEYDAGVEEFNWNKEYKKLYAEAKERQELFIWYRYRTVEGFDPKDVIYGCEYGKGRVDYWLITKPEVLKDFKYKYQLNKKGMKEFRKHKASLFTDKDEITDNSKISFVKVPEEVALYYRDVWAHKLGSTKAEQYFLMLIDGKVFGVVGFMLRHLFSLSDDMVFENFGFNVPLTKYPRVNRLLMMAITCKDFKRVLMASASNFNRFYEINGLKTTCLSKYRKVKLNNGLLEIEKREKMKNGFYKIVYFTKWHNESFDEVVKKYLEESR